MTSSAGQSRAPAAPPWLRTLAAPPAAPSLCLAPEPRLPGLASAPVLTLQPAATRLPARRCPPPPPTAHSVLRWEDSDHDKRDDVFLLLSFLCNVSTSHRLLQPCDLLALTGRERFSDPGNASKPTAGPARTRRRADGLPGPLTPPTGRGPRRRALALEPNVTRVAEERVTERLLRAYPSCRPHVGRDGPRLRESEAGVGGAA